MKVSFFSALPYFARSTYSPTYIVHCSLVQSRVALEGRLYEHIQFMFMH